MHTQGLLGAVLSGLLCACGGAAPHPSERGDRCEPPHPGEGHSLEVYVSVERGGQQRPLCPGQLLANADSLWVAVELDTASYVRMIFVSPDGESGELLRQDEADLTRRALYRAPDGLLARAEGEAQLVIVASRDPLSEGDPVMEGMLNVIRDTGTLVERDGTLRPPPSEIAGPGDVMRLDLGPEKLHADFDDKGVAILSITLKTSP